MILERHEKNMQSTGTFIRRNFSRDFMSWELERKAADGLIVELPFTRETWHGRMMASRGVMASMDEEKIRLFDQKHREMLEKKYPEEFTVKHKIFLTWYKM